MKKDNIAYLIDTLIKKNDWMTAKEIAVQMHVTTRSVRNYVKIINNNDTQEFIESGQLGYKWHTNISKSMLYIINSNSIENTPKNRHWSIIRKLLFQNCHTDQVKYTISDICNHFYISETIFFKDINSIRKILHQYNVSLEIKNEQLSLIGSELSLRYLLYNTILYFSDTDYLKKLYINMIFPQYNLDEIIDILQEALNENNLKCDAYHFNQLILNLLIQMFRINCNKLIHATEISIPSMNQLPEFKSASLFIKNIKEKAGIKYSWWEADYVTMLFLGFCYNAGPIPNQYEYIKSDVKFCLTHLANHENVNFDSSSLVDRLTDFFAKLKIRTNYNLSVKNPIRSSIRKNSPIYYDEAAWIFTYFAKKWNISLNSNEISYLTMIISDYINDISIGKPPIKTTLVYPAFYETEKKIINKLTTYFGGEIEINSVVDSFDISDKISNEMIISLIPLKNTSHYVGISSNFSPEDYTTIRKEIDRIEYRKNITYFSLILQNYSTEDYFETEHYFNSTTAAIKYICSKLKKDGYIDGYFEEIVLNRENIETTSYFNFIAIPHGISNHVKRNVIYIIMNQKPSEWGNRKINLIIFFAMTNDSWADYKTFYQTLIKLFENHSNMKAIQESKNYVEFNQAIKQLIKR